MSGPACISNPLLSPSPRRRTQARLCGWLDGPRQQAVLEPLFDEVQLADSVVPEACPFGEPFDVIIVCNFIEQRHPQPVLERLRAWLTPDGMLSAVAPTVRHHRVLGGLLRGHWTGRCPHPRPVPSPLAVPPSHGDHFGIRLADASQPESTVPSVTEAVTFGITAFKRPDCLRRLVTSIRAVYPDVRIVVADNGDEPAEFFDPHLEYLQLPFNCGLSASRNRLTAACRTPYLLLLEDDFVFTPATRIEPFVDVLETDPTVGCVAGALVVRGKRQDLAVRYQVFRHELCATQARGPYCSTPRGTLYQFVDMVFNFALFRRAMLVDHPWDERLKLCEHTDYFLGVKEARRWRVAFCGDVTCRHEPERSPEYLQYRKADENRTLYQLFLRKHDLERVRQLSGRGSGRAQRDKPNVLVFGVGHSGTSVVTRMLSALGWCGGRSDEDVDADYAEHIGVRALNDLAIARESLPLRQAQRVIEGLPEPWVIKDPRFVLTIDRWMPIFCECEPCLLWLVRDLGEVEQSYRRRQRRSQEPPESRGHTIEALDEKAQQTFRKWPWMKLRIDYERIREAVPLFDPAWQSRYGEESRLQRGVG